jgi:hypothetical protein
MLLNTHKFIVALMHDKRYFKSVESAQKMIDHLKMEGRLLDTEEQFVMKIKNG